MEMNYNAQEIDARMSLDEALKAYAGEIQILTLRDGTNIEIISDNYNFRSRPRMGEMGYTDNQLRNVEENDNEFIEENLVDNYNQYNYQQITPTKQGLLRGKGQNKGLGKSLRKTILRSIDGKEQEKQFENGLLRNLKSDKKKENLNLNTIISFTENNGFLQCANCNKFFCDEEEPQIQKKTVENKTQNNQNIPTNAQQFPQKPKQNMPYPQQFQPYPQQSPQQPKQNPKQQQKGHYQQGPQYPQNPPQKQNIPYNQQKIPQNMNKNMGFPQKQNPQGFPKPPTPVRGGGHQNVPNQQQFYQQKNMHGGFPGFNPQMGGQFRGNTQVFRARKREVNDYEEEYEDYNDNINDNNYVTEEIYYYPPSSKKFRSEKKISGIRKNISHNIENPGLTRNLSFGYKQYSNPRTEFSYAADNNLNEYIDMNENEYYEYPNYNERNLIPTGRTQQFDNHRVVNVKVTRNTPYQYQEYDDYEDYYYDN